MERTGESPSEIVRPADADSSFGSRASSLDHRGDDSRGDAETEGPGELDLSREEQETAAYG